MTALWLLLAAALLFLLSRARAGVRLLLRWPGALSAGAVRRAPPAAAAAATRFAFELRGAGWAKGEDVHAAPPARRVALKVAGANPGYGATVVCLLHSALTVLTQRDNLCG